MTFVNLTPHAIVLNGGESFPPSGVVARVSTQYTTWDSQGIATVEFGEVTNLPEPMPGVIYIASALVAQAAFRMGRGDVVSPATGHPDCIRENGQVQSVPGFIRQV